MKRNWFSKRERRRTLSALLLFSVFLAAFCLPFAFGGEDGESTLTIGVGRDFFDGPDSRTFLHGSTHTWEALTCFDDELNAKPWLAESWSASDDGRTWTFKLREGVRFHDGSLLTASLAKASIERIASRPKYDPAGMYRNLARLEAKDPRELVFHLTQPSPGFPNLVAYYSSPVIHPKEFDENGRLSGLTATGPFRVKEVRQGDRIALEAFPDYWGPKPAYDRVVFRAILDAHSRAMALIAGELDAVADVGGILPQQAEELGKAENATLKRVEVATTHYLLFNCRKPPFDDRAARLWIAGLLDREEMVAALVSGAGKVAQDPFSPLAKDWAFGHLLAEPRSLSVPPAPVEILLHSGTLERWPYRDIAQIVQAQLVAFGFDAKIVAREPGAYYEDLDKGRFNLALQPNTLMTGDPDFFYSYYVSSDGTRYCGCGNSEMDALIVRGRHSMDFPDRKETYRRLSLLFAEMLPLLPLYHETSFYAHGPRVEDFSMDGMFRPLLQKARPAGAR